MDSKSPSQTRVTALTTASIIEQKRQVFFTRIIYTTLTATGLSVFVTLYNKTYGAAVVDGCIFLINLFCLILNKQDYYKAARLLAITTLITALTGLITLYPIETGLYIFYLPISVAGFALFAPEEKKYKIILTILTIIFSIVVVVFKIDMGIKLPISTQDMERSYTFNFLVAMIFTWVSIDFLMKANAEAEIRLEELAQTLEKKNQQLEDTNKDLDRIIYSTTHDLRSPLASVKGLTDLATAETENTTLQEYFSMIKTQINKLDTFILDMLELSKQSKDEVKSSWINLSETVNEILDNLKFMDGFNQIKFDLSLNPHQIFIDKRKFTAIINNLVCNAVKYHDYSKESPYIKVTATYANGVLKMVISDNGLGISKENIKNIFNMFYRGSEQSTGSGLGLAIVTHTLEKLNGKIAVESEEGRGTTFTVTFSTSVK